MSINKESENLFQEIQRVSDLIPTPVYWMALDGTFIMGVNQYGLKTIGMSHDEFVGKSVYDLYPYELARKIVEHNLKAIQLDDVLSQEETIIDAHGNTKEFVAIKTPLKDNVGNIIGLIGTSIEITKEKEAERLRQKAEQLHHENEIKMQRLIIEEKEKLITLAQTVAHDISSPLSALNMMMRVCDELKESKRTVIKSAIGSILDIANNLLSSYRNEEQRAVSDIEQRQPLLISDWIIQLLSEKKVQYSNHAVRFETVIDNDAQFAFVHMQASQFRRSLSNLINNAVDALANKEHDTVTINTQADENFVMVEIQDNGKGMSPGMIEKMRNRQSFTEGKANGHGLGLRQVWDTLDTNQGTMSVSSIPNEGTTIQLTFPRICAASWIAQTIHLELDSIVVILDDEESIHGAWDIRFRLYLRVYPSLYVHHFKQGQEALDFFNALNPRDKDRVVFLSDYELLRQNKNGLQIIKESGIKNSTLVTSYYANSQIREKAMHLGVKILPKQMASIVPLEVNENSEITSS